MLMLTFSGVPYNWSLSAKLEVIKEVTAPVSNHRYVLQTVAFSATEHLIKQNFASQLHCFQAGPLSERAQSPLRIHGPLTTGDQSAPIVKALVSKVCSETQVTRRITVKLSGYRWELCHS